MGIFILLYILGLNMCQAKEVPGNSTQMYYVKLKIDESALNNISKILKPFVSNTSLHVDNVKVTTKCRDDAAGKTCFCTTSHKWSDRDCQSHQCCDKKECTFQTNLAQMCVPNTAVTIKGSITLSGPKYQDCLAAKTSNQYQVCRKDLLTEMKKVYSTLRGFDTLTITRFRLGSIIVEFEMTVASAVTSDLTEKSKILAGILPGSLDLETAGVISMSISKIPVCYNNETNIMCTTQEDLKVKPVWFLKRYNDFIDITSGTVADVTSQGRETKVRLKSVSELWAGEYICSYEQREGCCTIAHRARGKMDIAHLPNIDGSLEPQFPRCEKSSDVLNIRAKCEIAKSAEPYKVTWKGDRIAGESSVDTQDTKVFIADEIISCNQTNPGSKQLTCIFKNRCDQERSASIPINIIYESDRYCAAEGDWGDAKAGFTAVLKCKNATGLRQRKCDPHGRWEEEESACVNSELNNVLQSAIISDTGLGMLDNNVAHVFSRFEHVTNDTETINSYANVNASVSVLDTLNGKLQNITSESTADNLLASSSNLLEQSLEKVWITSVNEANSSLAERYLSSVEHLIKITNITLTSKKTNVEVRTCNHTQNICASSVFNVNISLKSSGNGNVKTAAFKHLQRYLPHNESEKYEPNSIVVSATTTENNEDPIEITIDFPLLKPRPPHVSMHCVFWDNSSRQWSEHGCRWEGSLNEARCICKHLSSFAILMSKYRMDIPWVSEITYFGLSVSVMSLIIILLIELLIWSHVVKTNTLYLRHTAHVNISLCLLVADCCFLASSNPHDITEIWCQTFVVLKHFCYLSMFFWMLSLSCTLLHQAVFLFHKVSKTHYLRFSLVLGYFCPFLIVFVTFLTNNVGAKDVYFSRDTCWLIYTGLLEGSIFTFLIPVLIIVFVNVFSMVVVIMKLLSHQNTDISQEKEKTAAKTVVRSVILLTPIFGVTWIFGYAVMILDLTSGPIALAVNYIFVLLNAFQGFFILLTTCLGDPLTRGALLNRFKKPAPPSTNISTVKMDPMQKK